VLLLLQLLVVTGQLLAHHLRVLLLLYQYGKLTAPTATASPSSAFE
jgi:hypothetical protein